MWVENRESHSGLVFKDLDMQNIVIVMGYNASGKSTLVQKYIDDGYYRLNRDDTGGTLEKQAELALQVINAGYNVVLDNTYPTIESRRQIIAVATVKKINIVCVWLTTSFEDSQMNACLRMMDRYDRILSPEELKKSKDPNAFPPAAIYNYRKIFEEPTLAEGFVEIHKQKFVRKWPEDHVNKAILLDYDGTLRRSVGKEEWPEKTSDVEVLSGRKEVLQQYVEQGYLLLGVSNQSAIAKGLPVQDVVDCFERTNQLLGQRIEYLYCPHNIPPVICYCRKPAPGMGAYFIKKHKLNPAECIMVGDQTTDKTFATRCGFQYKDAEVFFG